jgi:excinuclease ABC subunit A
MSGCCSLRSSPARSPASPFRDRATAVLLQQPVWRLPDLRWLGHPEDHSRPDCPGADLTLRGGAIAPWAKSSSPYYTQTLEALGKHFGFKLSDRGTSFPPRGRTPSCSAQDEDHLQVYDDGLRSYSDEDVRGRHSQSRAPLEGNRQRLGARGNRALPCRTPPARPVTATGSSPRRCAVKINGCHIGEVTELSIRVAGDWFDELPDAAQ